MTVVLSNCNAQNHEIKMQLNLVKSKASKIGCSKNVMFCSIPQNKGVQFQMFLNYQSAPVSGRQTERVPCLSCWTLSWRESRHRTLLQRTRRRLGQLSHTQLITFISKSAFREKSEIHKAERIMRVARKFDVIKFSRNIIIHIEQLERIHNEDL